MTDPSTPNAGPLTTPSSAGQLVCLDAPRPTWYTDDMAIIEAVCGKCGDTFNPGDEDDTIHLVREDGTECGGQGTITGEWGGPPKQYLSALPYDPTDRKPPRGTPQRDHDLFNDDERDDDMNPLEPETES